MAGYQDLDAWKKAMKLSREVGKVLRKLPKSQQYELRSQLSRAVESVPSNIAEGYGRGTRKEYVNFLKYARGSNNEVQIQLFLCEDMGYLKHEDLKKAIGLTYDVGRLLNRLIESLDE